MESSKRRSTTLISLMFHLLKPAENYKADHRKSLMKSQSKMPGTPQSPKIDYVDHDWSSFNSVNYYPDISILSSKSPFLTSFFHSDPFGYSYASRDSFFISALYPGLWEKWRGVSRPANPLLLKTLSSTPARKQNPSFCLLSWIFKPLPSRIVSEQTQNRANRLTQALCTHIRFHLKTKLFLYAYPMKTELFKNALQGGTFWKRCFRVYVWTDESGTFRKRWRHAISSNLLRAIL